ncbi:hypothetical protein ACFP6A_00030 [Quadrisphaera sp. GCM10027208]|uniref:hypothetical protein n=1 Tax=Quadrisphaera sp. GCM10027208 TaxID=3273423 RepID=UPI00361BE00B
MTTTAEPRRVALVDLTDEEVAVLATADGPVVLPYLGTLDDEQVATATTTAYRSLVARGLLTAPTPQEAREAARTSTARGEERVGYPVQMPETLAHLLRLRAGASTVVCVSVATALGAEYRYAHVVDDVVLVEEVTGTGLHRFSLVDVADLPTIVQGWVLHPEATPGTGEEIVQLPQRQGEPDPTPPDELLERLGSALVRADLVVRRAGDHSPELVGVFSGPSGTWTSRSRFGSAAPVVIRPATPDDVRDHVRVALAGEPA